MPSLKVVKTADSTAPLHPLLAERWSPRAFDQLHELTDRDVTALLEAARWAPSASNTQPWRFLVARRGTPEHAAVLGTLAAGNQAWAHAASALIVAGAQTVAPDGKPRPWALYDTGQAVAHLSVQAEHEQLAVHQIGGFNAALLTELLDSDDVTPLVVLAVGRRDEPATLAEPLAARERAPRERLNIDALQVTIAGLGVVPAVA